MLAELEAAGPAGRTTRELMATVNLGMGRLDAMLKVLDVEGAVTLTSGTVTMGATAGVAGANGACAPGYAVGREDRTQRRVLVRIGTKYKKCHGARDAFRAP